MSVQDFLPIHLDQSGSQSNSAIPRAKNTDSTLRIGAINYSHLNAAETTVTCELDLWEAFSFNQI